MSVRDVVPRTPRRRRLRRDQRRCPGTGGVPSGEVFEPDEELYGVPAGIRVRGAPGRAGSGRGCWHSATPPSSSATRTWTTAPRSGALGEALDAAGVPRAAIANADGAGYLQGPPFHRGAAVALVDERAVIPDGAVGPHLLEPAPEAPYGMRLSDEAVSDAFEASWSRGGVVLVEGSDLARADRYSRRRRHWHAEPRCARTALRWTDDLVADLLAAVDPARDSVLVVGPYHRRGPAHLTVAGLRAPDVEPGLLRSGTHAPNRDRDPRRHRTHHPRPGGGRPPQLHGGPPVRARRRRTLHRTSAGRAPRRDRRGGALPRPDGRAGGADVRRAAGRAVGLRGGRPPTS